MEKMHIYSGHDLTVISLLAALDIWNNDFANYAAFLAFELYNDTTDGNAYVKVRLKC